MDQRLNILPAPVSLATDRPESTFPTKRTDKDISRLLLATQYGCTAFGEADWGWRERVLGEMLVCWC